MTTIRSLAPDEWETYRRARLAALQDAPEAFGGSYEQSSRYPEQQWRGWCAQPSWFALDGDEPVGMVRVLQRPDGRDIPELISMWVAPAVRGTPVAADLVRNVVDWARREGHRALFLHVVDGNDRAHAFYHRMGFAETGARTELPDGRIELEMELDLTGHHPNPRLYLDDLTVGQEFRSEAHMVQREEVLAFATRFDPQPFHVDDEAAASSVFGGLAASGWHTAAMTMRMMADSVPLGEGLVGLGVELQWPQPVYPGDVIRLVTTVADIRRSRSKPDRGVVTLESRTVKQDGSVCQRMTGKVLLTRRPS